jgi:hypothetical protein
MSLGRNALSPFYIKRQPTEMGVPETRALLFHLNQHFYALLFLYLNVLKVLLAAHQPSEFLSNIHQ